LATIPTNTLTSLKGAYFIANGAFILAWVVASSFTKGQISDMEMDPNDDEDDRAQAN
jgi:hypothetical protein